LLIGFFILLLFYFFGELISHFSGVPIPGSVIGMLLLFFSLVALGRSPTSLLKVSSLLLKNLSLLFIPVCTGMVFFLGMLQSQWWILVLSVSVSSELAMLVVGMTMKFCLGITIAKFFRVKLDFALRAVNNG
jgi:holin-like protein